MVKAQAKAQEAADKAKATQSLKVGKGEGAKGGQAADAKHEGEPAAEPVDPAAGADLSNNSTADCPKVKGRV